MNKVFKFIQSFWSREATSVNIDLTKPLGINKNSSLLEIVEYINNQKDSYSEEIDQYITSKEKNAVCYNNTEDHTNVILSKMLQNSREKMLIYDRDLSGDLLLKQNGVDLLQDFKNYLSTNQGTIEIVIDPNTSQKVVEKLLEIGSDNLKLFQINNQQLLDKGVLNSIPYFAVSDDQSYRLELKKAGKGREATCSFNDKETTQKLTNLFDKLKDKSKPLSSPVLA